MAADHPRGGLGLLVAELHPAREHRVLGPRARGRAAVACEPQVESRPGHAAILDIEPGGRNRLRCQDAAGAWRYAESWRSGRSDSRSSTSRRSPRARPGPTRSATRSTSHARGGARLCPLLGGRASRDADARLRVARDPRRRGRGRDRAHPGRERRRDAVPLQPIQGRRAVRILAGSTATGSTSASAARPAPTSRRSSRSSATAASHSPTTSGAARRAARLLRGRVPARPRVRAPRPPARAAATCGCSGCRRRPRSGPPSSAFPTRSPTSSIPSRPRARCSTVRASGPAAATLPRSPSGSAWSAPRPARRPTGSPRAGGWRSRWPAAASSGPCRRWTGHGLPQGRAEQGDGFAGRRVVVGPPGSVRARLQQIAAEYTADELVVLTMTHDHAARRRSYELIAEELGLATLEE